MLKKSGIAPKDSYDILVYCYYTTVQHKSVRPVGFIDSLALNILQPWQKNFWYIPMVQHNVPQWSCKCDHFFSLSPVSNIPEKSAEPLLNMSIIPI